MSQSGTVTETIKPDIGWVRYLGVLTGLSFLVLLFAQYFLTGRAAAIVGGLALLFVTVAGAQFFFHGTTLISAALGGRRRIWFQIAVTLAAPIGFGAILANRADAIPLTTVFRILTPWVLIPLGMIASICWFAGDHLNREHPFRGFLIAATVLGLLCFLWSERMVSDSDYNGENSTFYLDPEKARRARETGEYVWRFALYVTTAYLVLFIRLKRCFSSRDEAFRELNDKLTPAVVSDIVAKMGAHVANRATRYGRESDLPYPRVVIEAAFIKALRHTPEGPQLETLKKFYMFLDDHMLSDADADTLNRWHDFLATEVPEGRLVTDPMTLAAEVQEAGADRAQKLTQELYLKGNERNKRIETIRGA